MVDDLRNNHQKMIDKLKIYLPNISRNVWTCDPQPNNYEEGLNI